VVLASLALASGCGGTTSKPSAAERAKYAEEAAKAKHALEQIRPGCSHGKVLVRITRTSWACVEPQNAQVEVERSIKRQPGDNPCPQGTAVLVNLQAGAVECVVHRSLKGSFMR
jgi:hypothetical protein